MQRFVAAALALTLTPLGAASAYAMDGVPWGEALIIVAVWAGLLFFVILNPATALGIVLAALLIEKRWWAVGAGASWGVAVAAVFGVFFEGSLEDVAVSAFQYCVGGALWTWIIHAVAQWARRRRSE